MTLFKNLKIIQIEGSNKNHIIMLYLLLFQLLGGPSYSLRLCAEVTRPSMELSSHEMDFGQVVCGQCKIITVRLKNTRTVR